MTSPPQRARPAQSWPPPRTDNGRSHSRAARIAAWTSCGVRQCATARGIGAVDLAQIAVAVTYASSPGSDKRPESCSPKRCNAFAVTSVMTVLLLNPCGGNLQQPQFWDTVGTSRED